MTEWVLRLSVVGEVVVQVCVNERRGVGAFGYRGWGCVGRRWVGAVWVGVQVCGAPVTEGGK